MKKSFEDISVRQDAFILVKELGDIFYNSSFKNYSFQDQIMRATISITNNIAEGNDRGSAKDYPKFLIIAKGSCAEARNMIYIAHRFKFITEEQKTYFIEKSTSISQ